VIKEIITRMGGGMSAHTILAVVGGFCGTAGSIITAFGVNRSLKELYLGQQFISVTVEGLATRQPDVPVFVGTERRFERAQSHDAKVVWVGVALLALGFILQAVSTVIGG
jgi:hypothetical protein